jgi:hypothetical protein
MGSDTIIEIVGMPLGSAAFLFAKGGAFYFVQKSERAGKQTRSAQDRPLRQAAAQTVRLRLFSWANALWSLGKQAHTERTGKAGRLKCSDCFRQALRTYPQPGEDLMNNIVYIVGLIVIVIAILSFFGLR